MKEIFFNEPLKIPESADNVKKFLKSKKPLHGPGGNIFEIKKAVEAAYGVTVDKVRTLNYGPERKMRYTKTGIQKGQTNSTKKAIVQVADGNSIDFYSKDLNLF